MELKDVISVLSNAPKNGRPEFGRTVTLSEAVVTEIVTALRSVQRTHMPKAEAEKKIAEADQSAVEAEAEKLLAEEDKKPARHGKRVYGAQPE